MPQVLDCSIIAILPVLQSLSDAYKDRWWRCQM